MSEILFGTESAVFASFVEMLRRTQAQPSLYFPHNWWWMHAHGSEYLPARPWPDNTIYCVCKKRGNWAAWYF